MMHFDSYFKNVLTRGGFKSSALAPLLWLNALVTVPCLFLGFFSSGEIKWVFFVVAVAIILFTLHQYNNLAKKDPRLLQSERFQIEAMKWDIVAQKGGPFRINPVNIPMSEPTQLMLPSEKTDERDDDDE